MGSTRSSELFCQVTDKMRLADVDADVFETPTSKDRLVYERTVAKNEAMSESRTFPPDADAAKFTLIARPYHRIRCGGAVRFTQTG